MIDYDDLRKKANQGSLPPDTCLRLLGIIAVAKAGIANFDCGHHGCYGVVCDRAKALLAEIAKLEKE